MFHATQNFIAFYTQTCVILCTCYAITVPLNMLPIDCLKSTCCVVCDDWINYLPLHCWSEKLTLPSKEICTLVTAHILHTSRNDGERCNEIWELSTLLMLISCKTWTQGQALPTTLQLWGDRKCQGWLLKVAMSITYVGELLFIHNTCIAAEE